MASSAITWLGSTPQTSETLAILGCALSRNASSVEPVKLAPATYRYGILSVSGGSIGAPDDGVTSRL